MQQICFGIVVLVAFGLVHGQVPFPGSCPDVKIPEQFNLDSYLGKWYEYEKYPFVFEVGRKCQYAEYQKISDDAISVVNYGINRFTGRTSNVTGTAQVVGPSRLRVRFPSMRASNTTKSNYDVLGTDYTSYAVVYSCKSLMNMAHTKVLWVLTREQVPSESVIQQAEAVIDANNLNKSFLMKTKQTDCDIREVAGDVGDEGQSMTAPPPPVL